MSRVLEIIRYSVLDVRKRLRAAYCVTPESLKDNESIRACRGMGKRRVLKYTSAHIPESGDPEEYYRRFLAPYIKRAIDTKVTIAPPKDMISRSGDSIHDMMFWTKPSEIKIVNNISSAYANRYGTKKGFRKYIKFVLYHEFGHALDYALNIAWRTSTSSGAFTRDVKSISAGGGESDPYFDMSTEYGRREVFAEWSALQDLLGGTLGLGDIENLCYIKKKYPKRDRIKIKAERGYEITELDYVMQSALIQSFLNCDDHKDTLKRLNSMGLKAET